MRLLLDIRSAFNGREEADILRDGIDAFVCKFWAIELDDDGGATSTVDINPADQYDEFCAVIKARRLLIGKHRTVVGLIKNALSTEHDSSAHMDRLIKMLRISCGAAGGLGFNEPHTDVTVEFIRDFVDVFPLSAHARSTELVDLFDNNIVGVCSPMCRFKVHDLVERCRVRRPPPRALPPAKTTTTTHPLPIPKPSRRW
jgi:hypothetical protein